MTGPEQSGPSVVHVPAPLQWQIAHGQAPDGTKVLVIVLTQGLLVAQVTLGLIDSDRLGRNIVDATAQARTGLILPGSAGAPRINGGGPTG
jgi:hypothetical protein